MREAEGGGGLQSSGNAQRTAGSAQAVVGGDADPPSVDGGSTRISIGGQQSQLPITALGHRSVGNHSADHQVIAEGSGNIVWHIDGSGLASEVNCPKLICQ